MSRMRVGKERILINDHLQLTMDTIPAVKLIFPRLAFKGVTTVHNDITLGFLATAVRIGQ